ncbi:MAG TPA: hypothetical protein P5572_19145, partial [Phycisphaerae bacterium]|nr:hypothetical protein [Phycisphaerae bacterium]
MAFDVYVGTMTRYFRRDWENIVQQTCRDRGQRYEMVYAGGKPAPPPPTEQVRAAVNAWREGLSRALAEHGQSPLDWDEGDDKPYFTDRPGWGGYGSLLVWAAHAEHSDLPVPEAVPESWADDEAYSRSTADGFRSRYARLLTCELWLPDEFSAVFSAATVATDQPQRMGSVFRLKDELDELHAATAQR